MPTVSRVSQTPTYDQLRGERINADVPASEDNSARVDQCGKHRLLDDAMARRQAPEPEADPTADWSWFESADSDAGGKHHRAVDAQATGQGLGPRALRPGSGQLDDPETASSPRPHAALPPVTHARS